jgi:hypothetical protein
MLAHAEYWLQYGQVRANRIRPSPSPKQKGAAYKGVCIRAYAIRPDGGGTFTVEKIFRYCKMTKRDCKKHLLKSKKRLPFEDSLFHNYSLWRDYTPLKMENPPSTQIMEPVTNADASLSSHTRAPINSSGLPKRLNGVCLITDAPRSV